VDLDAGERRVGEREEPAAGKEGGGGSMGARGFAGGEHEGGGDGRGTAVTKS
jgi:hypothetical protein